MASPAECATIPTERPSCLSDDLAVTIGAADEVESLFDYSSNSLEECLSKQTQLAAPEAGDAMPPNFPAVIASTISNMTAVRPEIIRAAPAYRALAFCALPLWGVQHGNFVHFSAVTDRIDEFWSQSWHGPRWKLILTIIFLNNSLAAAVISVGIAVVLGVLYACKVLPVMYEYNPSFQQIPRCGWSGHVALIVYYVTLLAWRRRKRIFLDVLCIDQDDTANKTAALFSMGAFLKCSDALLVLWDETYTKRLWCVFELAAFLKSRPAGKKINLVIRPTITGPCFLGLTFSLNVILYTISFVGDRDLTALLISTAAITCLGLLCSISAARSYFRSINDLKRALSTFRLEDACCWCCDTGHQEKSLCDRKVIEQCVINWFGSVDAFEELVRQEVLDILRSQLWRQMLSYKQCVLALVPVIIASIDIVFALIYRDSYSHAVVEALRGLAMSLGVGPMLFFVGFKLSQCLHQPCCSRPLDFLVTLFIVVVMCGTLVASLMLEQLLWWHPIPDFNPLGGPTLIYGSCIHTILFVGLAATCFCCRRTTFCVDKKAEGDGKRNQCVPPVFALILRNCGA